jgi:hypothetical protein
MFTELLIKLGLKHPLGNQQEREELAKYFVTEYHISYDQAGYLVNSAHSFEDLKQYCKF